MLSFAGTGLLLDVEGTTSSLAYVSEVLFPYARRELVPFLHAHWEEEDVASAREALARDAGAASFEAWFGRAGAREPAIERIRAEVLRLMALDAKATGLKQLQGLIWREGFVGGALRAHVFPDVPPALAAWRTAGLDVRIFSSGSRTAQRLFFAHTEAGDLTPFLRGHYDTTLGPKRSPASYSSIARDMRRAPAALLFLSDVVAELDAARDAGLATGLVLRPGNPPVPAGHGHAEIADFGAVAFLRSG
ncbi:MAG: acireductone synthase [Planctomycetes bacterium]|nr:acireductone synthase [Planctomycetota bacterium]